MARWLRVLVFVALVLVEHRFGPWFSIRPRAHPPDRAGVRVVSWNLQNFPRPDQDLDRLGDSLRELDADVLVLQEVHDAAALGVLLPEHRVIVSRSGGRHGQGIAIAWDPRRVTAAGEPIEDPAPSLGGRVRPLVHARFQTPIGALGIVAVHLKAGADGLPLRQLQWISVAAHLAAGDPDVPVVLLGDFNAAGGRQIGAAEERALLDPILDAAGLTPRRDVRQCTAYWEGVRRDGWWVGSALDLVFASRGVITSSPWIGGACDRHGCDPLHSTRSAPDPDLGLSDHCPVVIDVLESGKSTAFIEQTSRPLDPPSAIVD